MELIDTLRECLTDRYELERELGGGGMSRVFLATERALSRRVVIKVLSPELGQAVNVDRFRLEIATSATLQHPQIVPVYGTGSCGDLLYYIMPFVAGESLRAHLDRVGPMPADEVSRILTLLARGLAYAHREGVVHRDIKPENILLAQGEPMLADFGIAKVIRQGNNATGLTSSGMSIGTVTYMAPEQVVADPTIDGRADIYSLAALGYELLTGAPPFTGTPQQVMSAHVVKAAVDVSTVANNVPASLAIAVMRGLTKEAVDRPDAEAFAAMLNSQTGSGATTGGAASQSSGRTRRMPIVIGVAVLAAAAIAAVAIRSGTSRDNVKTPADTATTGTGIAVLPFENIGAVGTDAYFAAGLTAELTTAIGKVPGVRTTSQSTMRAYADSSLPPTELGKRLGVGALVEGTAQRAGDKLRVTARLIDAADGHALWSESYDRTAADLFATQSEISQAIVSALAPRFGTAKVSGITNAGTRDAGAYDVFLRARFAQDARDLKAALADYQLAASRDTAFARAFAGIAEASALLPTYGMGSHKALAPQITAAAATALRLDSTLAEPHTALGLLAKGTGDWSTAERELRRAASLQSQSGAAHQSLGELLYTLGRFDDASAALSRAVLLEPLNGVIISEYAYALMMTGQQDSAQRTIDRALLLDARNPFSLYTKGIIAERAGNFSGAVQPIAAAVAIAPQPFFLGALIRVARLAGDSVTSAQARGRLNALGSASGTSLGRAIADVGVAAPRDILGLLQRAVREQDPFMYLLPLRTWWFDPVRDTPEFAAIVRSLGLPESARIRMTSLRR
jgi:eukaryotic-like serine/threonine-protein kinase